MRTTSSRFSRFVAQVDAGLEDRPTAPAAPQAAVPTAVAPSLSVLEQRHAGVIQTLALLWGYPELNQFFEKVYSGRDSTLNLGPDAMAELMVLARVHQHICPHRPAKPVQDIYGVGRRADPWKPLGPRR